MQLHSLNEVLRIVDAKEEEGKWVESKYYCKKNFIDMEARNSF